MNELLDLKTQVIDKYNRIAQEKTSCCGTEDCSFVGEHYDTLDGYVEDADLGLGCGLPTQFVGILPGHTVVDLGSGAGNDVFIARREVGETGRVVGIDIAEEMLSRAQKNLSKSGYTNVEFRYGDIEDIPMKDNFADVVVSNCVMNLVPDKQRAYQEVFRILRPGGHFCISDIVIKGTMPDSLRASAELYVGCVSGAQDMETYLRTISAAGFGNITIHKERRITLSDELLDKHLDAQIKAAFINSETGIFSITISGTKPQDNCCGSECCD